MELIRKYSLLYCNMQSNKCLLRLIAEAKLRWLMNLKAYLLQGTTVLSHSIISLGGNTREIHVISLERAEEGVSIKGSARYFLIPYEINILEYF